MLRVIMVLFTLMQILFMISYVTNNGIIFFSIYFWIMLSLISIGISLINIYSKTNQSYIKYRRPFSYVLLITTIITIIYIILIIVMHPRLYLLIQQFLTDTFNIQFDFIHVLNFKNYPGT